MRSVVAAVAVVGCAGVVPVCLPVTGHGPVAVAPVAGADEMDDLIGQLSQISRDAEAKNEEVMGLEERIAGQKTTIEQLQRDADRARDEAMAARNREDYAKQTVSKLAQAKYRQAGNDPITEVMSADGPQSAIDRSAYLASLSARTNAAVKELGKASRAAAKKADAAARKKAEADFAERDLEHRRRILLKENEELAKQKEEVRKRIDSLTIEERMRWAARMNPQDYSIEDLGSENVDGLKALQKAFTKLGAPYVWGATGPDEFDCSGLVVWSYAQIGKRLPRTSQAQMRAGVPVPKDKLQPGDVVGFYPGATHVGLYAGNGMIIHASDYGIPLQVVPMASMPYYGARRY